jgi:hypothetical protein
MPQGDLGVLFDTLPIVILPDEFLADADLSFATVQSHILVADALLLRVGPCPRD